MSEEQWSSTVVLTDVSLRLTQSLEIFDDEVRRAAAAVVERGEDLETWLAQVVRLGVAAAALAANRSDMARLERAVHEVDRRISKVVGEAVDELSQHVTQAVDPERNGLAAVSRDSMQRLNEGVTRLVSGNDAVLASNIRALVGQVFADAQQSIHQIVATQAASTQQVLQQDRAVVRDSLLASLDRQHGELRTAMAEIHQALAVIAAVQQVKSKTPQRGTDYETDAVALINRVAARAGDAGGLVHTGRVSGDDGTLVGDITCTLASNGSDSTSPAKLVIECKDRRSKGSKPSLAALAAEGRAARSNRAAAVSLILSPPEAMPTDQLVVVLERDSLLVCWQPGDDDDLVTACWLLLKMLALSKSVSVAGAVDVERAQTLVDAARAATMRIDRITKEAGQAERSLTRLKEHAADMRTELLRRLLQLSQTLNGDVGQDDGDPVEAAPAA